MTAESKTAIKAYFETGDVPTQAQFINLIDSYEDRDVDILKADTSDDLTVGYTATSYSAGTKSSGTYTPDPTLGNFQHATNGGAHTLAPPSACCSIVIEYLNNGSAGAITTSGFTDVEGSFTTTNGHKFHCVIIKGNAYSSLTIKALQ